MIAMGFYWGLGIGIFIGAFIGIFIAGLLHIAGDADDRAGRPRG